jgi:hypothetical protein
MSERMKIDIHNAYDFVVYDYDYENQVMGIFWDNTNDEINKFMTEETNCFAYNHIQDKKYSCMWVEQLKKYVNYELGDTIPFQTKYQYGYFHIFVKKGVEGRFIFEEIRDDGCLYICPYGDIGEYLQFTPHDKNPNSSLSKCNCLYNDIMEESCNSYILK